MINNVVLMGRLTAAPELRQTQSGVAKCNFSIAVEKRRGEEKQVNFINIVCWRGTAELVSKWFDKGDMIALQGEIQTRKWTAEDGTNRVAFEVLADKVSFTGSKKNDNNPASGTVTETFDDFGDLPEAPDDLPW